jgi:hypothetical protein
MQSKPYASQAAAREAFYQNRERLKAEPQARKAREKRM